MDQQITITISLRDLISAATTLAQAKAPVDRDTGKRFAAIAERAAPRALRGFARSVAR